jgi:hypothetical protein
MGDGSWERGDGETQSDINAAIDFYGCFDVEVSCDRLICD